MNIVYTLNDKFVPQVAAGICSVCENNLNASNINFYLISNEISDENKALLEEFVKSYKRKISIIELGDIKKYFDLAFNGETIVVSRKENKNVVVISEQEYNELQRAKRNAEYLAKLDRSFAQLKQGEVVIKSMEELERMADE